MSRRRAVGPWLLLALLALALAGGCNTGIAEGEAERRLRNALPTLIGPAASYRVNIRASSDISVVEGRLRHITIEGHQVRIANQWLVDDLLVVLERVKVNVDRQTLEKVGSARFQVGIRPVTLARYLDGDEDNLRDVNIIPGEGVLTIVGRYRLLKVWAPFRVSGTLELLDKRRIGFRTSRASAVGIPVPEVLTKYLERRLNPVLDVSDALMPIDLTEVRTELTGVVVAGTPDLNDPSLLTAPPRR